MEAQTYPYDPDYVIHPGATLQEWFQQMHFPYSIAWKLYGVPNEETLNGIIDGTQEITPELAQALSNFTLIGVPFWLALEHNFRVGLAAGKHWVGNEA